LLQIHAIERRLPWNATNNPADSRGRAVVLGSGPVGLLGAMALVNAAIERTSTRGNLRQDSRGGLAASFGAQYVCSRAVRFQLGALVGNIDVVYGHRRVAYRLRDA